MPHYARILEIRLIAREDVQIRTANAHAGHAQQYLARGSDRRLGLLVPAVPGRLDAWPVSTEVNNHRNNGPQLIEPIPAE